MHRTLGLIASAGEKETMTPRKRKSKLSPMPLWGCKAGFTPRHSGSGTAQDKKHEHHLLSRDEAGSDSPRC